MIRGKMKKIWTFAVAVAVAASMMPAMSSPSFAAEEDAQAQAEQQQELQFEEVSEEEMEALQEQEQEALQAPEQKLREEPREEDANAEEPTVTEEQPQETSKESIPPQDLKATKVGATYTKLSVNSRTTGSISSRAEKWYYFNTTSNDSFYEIKFVNSTSKTSLYATLYDKDKVKMNYVYANGNNSAQFDYKIDDAKLRPGSRYYIKLGGDYSASVNYIIYLTEHKDDFGDTSDKARKIGSGTTTGKIDIDRCNGYDLDWMKFTAPSSGKYIVKFTNKAKRNLYFNAYDNDVVKFNYSWVYGNESAAWDPISLKQGESMYIRVDAYEMGKYTVSINKQKKVNPISVSSHNKKYSRKALKKHKKTFTAIKVRNAQGAVSFKKVKGSSKLKVNSQTGKITVKKKTKKGTYKIKVKVRAAGNANYKAGSKTVTVTVRVK